jgi:capsular polysaccharide biosynthesis protein
VTDLSGSTPQGRARQTGPGFTRPAMLRMKNAFRPMFGGRMALVVGFTAIGWLGGLALGRTATQLYLSSCYTVVNAGATSGGPGNAEQAINLAQTYATEIPENEAILRQVAQETGATTDDVGASLSVTADNLTAVLVISYRAPSAARSVQGATDACRVISARQGPTSIVAAGTIQVSAYPRNASITSSKRRDAPALGLMAGFLLSLVLILVRRRADPRILNLEDLEAVLATPAIDLSGAMTGPDLGVFSAWSDALHQSGPVTLVPATDRMARLAAQVGAGLLRRRPDSSVAIMEPPILLLSLSRMSGSIVLLVEEGGRARTVRSVAGDLALAGSHVDWAVLAPPDVEDVTVEGGLVEGLADSLAQRAGIRRG